jgi:hypothetical protein
MFFRQELILPNLGSNTPKNGTPTNELLKADFDPSVLLKKVFSTP